jgi:hypothetical protein
MSADIIDCRLAPLGARAPSPLLDEVEDGSAG